MLARRGTRELGTGREQENGRNKRWCGGLDREEELKGGGGERENHSGSSDGLEEEWSEWG